MARITYGFVARYRSKTQAADRTHVKLALTQYLPNPKCRCIRFSVLCSTAKGCIVHATRSRTEDTSQPDSSRIGQTDVGTIPGPTAHKTQRDVVGSDAPAQSKTRRSRCNDCAPVSLADSSSFPRADAKNRGVRAGFARGCRKATSGATSAFTCLDAALDDSNPIRSPGLPTDSHVNRSGLLASVSTRLTLLHVTHGHDRGTTVRGQHWHCVGPAHA